MSAGIQEQDSGAFSEGSREGRKDQSPCEYLTSGDVARRYGVSLDTVNRWQRGGIIGPGGVRVWLRSIRVGGYRKTTWEWVEEFIAACEGGEPVSTETPARQQRNALAAQERLARRLGSGKEKG